MVAIFVILSGIFEVVSGGMVAPKLSPSKFKCYECSGRTGDESGCASPFQPGGLPICEGLSCFTTRQLLDSTAGSTSRTTSFSSTSTCGSWTILIDSGYRGGWTNGTSTISECMALCVQNTACASVDWKPYEAKESNCVLHGTGSTDVDLVPQQHSYHFDLTRTPDNCLPCGATWFATANVGFTEGLPNSVSRLKECMAACISDQHNCIGIDFSANKPRGQRCKLNTVEVNAQFVSVPGNTHYDVYKKPSCKANFEVVVRNCSQNWSRRFERGCRAQRGARYSIICSCRAALCNTDSEAMTSNEYFVSRELFFEHLLDINTDTGPLVHPQFWRRRLTRQLIGDFLSGNWNGGSHRRSDAVSIAVPRIADRILVSLVVVLHSAICSWMFQRVL